MWVRSPFLELGDQCEHAMQLGARTSKIDSPFYENSLVMMIRATSTDPLNSDTTLFFLREITYDGDCSTSTGH